VAVTDLISQGKLLKAENLCRQFMTQVPNHVEGMRLLAEIGIRLGVLDDAEYLLETAVALEPENTQARIDYISALRKRQNYEKALTQSRELLKGAPKNHQFRSIFAIESMQTGDFDTAIQIFDEILNDLPDDPLTHTTKGHALKTIGRSDDAVRSYKMAIRSNRGHGEAYYALANLKTYRFDQNEMSLLAELVEDPNLSFMDRVYMSFSLGKAYEDGKDFPQSFKFYEKGNKLKKTQSRYSAEKMSEEFELQKSVCDRAFFSARNGVGNVSGAPIFIVGLPRAGSTLLEQILSSHSKVDGTLELPNILSLSQQLRRRTVNDETIGYPGVLKKLENEEFCRFGEKFIEDTQIHRQGSPYFIDKMPNNFRHIGLIKLILPNAKIIDARRNAMDCCFSGFKQLFAEGQEFSYDLADLGQYYKDYVKLMTHWDEVLPNFVLRVNNEDVIDDLEGEVRRMLDFCGLDFEEECLHFYKNKRNVRTPSAEQVRQPVSKFGVARWKPYEEFLLPLKNSLGL
jgi:tetratricopeptide (TPR) repeat protein